MTRSLILPAFATLALLTASAALADCGACHADTACQACAAKDAHVEPNTLHLGLGGYSPVSYFTHDKPHFGSPQFQATHEGVTYFFANAEEQSAFEKNPAKYAPAYGGWCAYGMAVEGKFDADPTSYKIVDGRLFVFLLNDEIDTRELWNQGDDAQQTRKADAHWDKLNG